MSRALEACPVRTTNRSATGDACFFAKEQSSAHRLAHPLAAQSDESEQSAGATRTDCSLLLPRVDVSVRCGASRISEVDLASNPVDLRLSANPLRGVEIAPDACVVAHQRRGTVAQLLGDVRRRL